MPRRPSRVCAAPRPEFPPPSLSVPRRPSRVSAAPRLRFPLPLSVPRRPSRVRVVPQLGAPLPFLLSVPHRPSRTCAAPPLGVPPPSLPLHLGLSGRAGPSRTRRPVLPRLALPLPLPLDVACIPRPSTASCGSTIPSTSPRLHLTPPALDFAAAAPFALALRARHVDRSATGTTSLLRSDSD